MESLFFKLEKILREQNTTTVNLLDAASEHNLAMRDNYPEAIIAAVKKQEQLMNTLRQQDEMREKVQSLISKELNLEKGTLTEIINLLPNSKLTESISRVSEELLKNFNELLELNQLNRVLAKNGLLFTDQLRKIYAPKSNDTYQSSGKVDTQNNSISMLNKTI